MIQSGHDKCRVLIVESDDDIRTGLARELIQLGHEVALERERDQARQEDRGRARTPPPAPTMIDP